jgi:hypothetical protein
MNPTGPWDTAQARRFLTDMRVPLRLAVHGTSGHPVLVSLWYLPLEGRLWCATQQSAHAARLLERDPRCGYEVSVESPPYRGVRGTARATLHAGRGEEILRGLIDRYLESDTSRLAQSLLARVDTEVAISIEPRTMVTWDFEERMRDAVQSSAASG